MIRTRRNQFRRLFIAAIVLACLSPSLVATPVAPAPAAASGWGSPAVLVAQRSRTQRIQFDPGADSATVQTAVVRGTRNIYLLGAQRGQTMTVRVESLEHNALFDIEAPSSQTGYRRILAQGSSSWSGKLPATGDYQLVVGSSRGNATYRLYVRIR